MPRTNRKERLGADAKRVGLYVAAYSPKCKRKAFVARLPQEISYQATTNSSNRR